jgi:hypothetical protein
LRGQLLIEDDAVTSPACGQRNNAVAVDYALYFLAPSLLVSAVKFNSSLSSALMMGRMEKRIAQRRRVLKAGMIVFPGGTFNRIVRNLSEQGAALDLLSLIAIPNDFTLVIPTGGARFFCQSVWRNERRIGVAFASLH